MKHESGQILPEARSAGSMSEAGTAARTRHALFWAVAASLLLMLLPWLWPALSWLAWPQVMIATLVHELGHGFAALLSGGGFESLQVYADGSGVAHTHGHDGRWQRAWIAAGGPLGPPLVALVLFAAACRARLARVALCLIALLLGLALLIWVRNLVGVGLVVVCAGVTALVAWRAPALPAQAFTCFVAVQLCLATLSRLGDLFVRGARTGAGELASDTMQIAGNLGGPHWFWGSAIALVSAGVLFAGLALFLRGLGVRRGG